MTPRIPTAGQVCGTLALAAFFWWVNFGLHWVNFWIGMGTAASALAFMVFSQLYTPCMTALGTIKKETNSWYWMGFAAVSQFVIAWAVSLVVYRIALALGL